MKTIAASEARKSFASVLEDAAREPVVIRRHERDVAVVLSMQDYGRLVDLNKAEFQRFCDLVGQRAVAQGMNEEHLAELLNDGPGDDANDLRGRG
jgi:prevent-host-death family protein